MICRETHKETTLPNGKVQHTRKRYYINGTRVSERDYRERTDGKQGSCFHTAIQPLKDGSRIIRQSKVV